MRFINSVASPAPHLQTALFVSRYVPPVLVIGIMRSLPVGGFSTTFSTATRAYPRLLTAALPGGKDFILRASRTAQYASLLARFCSLIPLGLIP
jgi:hypothetical protein